MGKGQFRAASKTYNSTSTSPSRGYESAVAPPESLSVLLDSRDSRRLRDEPRYQQDMPQ